MGDQVKRLSPKKLKSLIVVPNVVHVKVHVFTFNIIFLSSPWLIRRPSYPFGETLGDKVRVRSPKEQKIFPTYVKRNYMFLASI